MSEIMSRTSFSQILSNNDWKTIYFNLPAELIEVPEISLKDFSLPFDKVRLMFETDGYLVNLFLQQTEPNKIKILAVESKTPHNAELDIALNACLCMNYIQGEVVHPVAMELYGNFFKYKDEDDVQTAIANSKNVLFHFLHLIHNKNTNIVIEQISKGKHLRQRFGRSLVNVDRVIHIRREDETVKSITGGRIDFNHRFEVRGHWRKLKYDFSYGKNRQGEKNVKGYTWVIPHERGEGELVKKTRVVHGELE